MKGRREGTKDNSKKEQWGYEQKGLRQEPNSWSRCTFPRFRHAPSSTLHLPFPLYVQHFLHQIPRATIIIYFCYSFSDHFSVWCSIEICSNQIRSFIDWVNFFLKKIQCNSLIISISFDVDRVLDLFWSFAGVRCFKQIISLEELPFLFF